MMVHRPSDARILIIGLNAFGSAFLYLVDWRIGLGVLLITIADMIEVKLSRK